MGPHIEALNRICLELKQSRTEEKRAAAVTALKQHVVNVSRDSSGEALAKFNTELRNRMRDLVNSNNTEEKKSGVRGIDALIDVDTEDNANKMAYFANNLRNVLPSSDVALMEMAVHSLGRLACVGGTLSADIVEFWVARAFEWLSGDKTERRHAAVLLLREFSQTAPTLFYIYIQAFFDGIWVATVDKQQYIREAAVEALHSSLRLISQRNTRLRNEWLTIAYEHAQEGLNVKNNGDVIHGSLLIVRELVRDAPDFLEDHFDDVCAVLKFKEHKQREVRKLVIQLVPLLAAFNPERFVSLYCSECVVFILSQARTDKDKSVAFLALGELMVAIGPAAEPYVPDILAQIDDALTLRRSRSGFCVEVLTCVSLMVSALGHTIEAHVADLVQKMLFTGLTPQLVGALQTVADHLPSMKEVVTRGLLDMISLILEGRPYVQLGKPRRASSSRNLRIKDTGAKLSENPAFTALCKELSSDPTTVAFALQTLTEVSFTEYTDLTEFVRRCVVDFLESDSADVRAEAAAACSSLLVQPGQESPTSGHVSLVVGEVLQKLLVTGITDPDPRIRLCVLAALDARFDHHLAEAENLRALFLCLNDEIFDIRMAAMSTIGRLTIRNPAYVMPSLRKKLIQLLTELEFGSDANKEESAMLLGRMIGSAQSLVRPYVEPIIKALMPKLEPEAASRSPVVASCVLGVLGELAQVAGEDMLVYNRQLLPLIIETLMDQSSVSKREVALRTLGQLCSSTGDVITPYLDYPNLMDILISSLRTEQSPAIRLELIKVMGILGAIDPYAYKVTQLQVGAADADDDNAPGPLLAGMGPSAEEYYPTVAITNLMAILRDYSLAKHHRLVVATVVQIVESLGKKAVPFLPQIMPPMLSMMQTCDYSLCETLFQNIGTLINVVQSNIRDYLDDIFALIRKFWDTDLIIQIIDLVERISLALNDEFKVYMPVLIPQMLAVLQSDVYAVSVAREAVLHALETFGASLDDYLHILVPAMVQLFESDDESVQLCAIRCLGHLCSCVTFNEYASRIIHPLARVLENSAADVRAAAIDTLCALVYQMGIDFAVFIPMVARVMSSKRINSPAYEGLVTKLLKGQLRPQDKAIDRVAAAVGAAAEDSEDTEIGKLVVNQQALQKVWETSQQSTKEDWLEWIRKFSVELLKQSSSPALRSCWALAQVYHPLAKVLFNASFVSCWTELMDQYQEELVHAIETALISPTIPAEVLQQLLNLAEFMEHDDKALPIDIRRLGRLAEKCHAYAKALHYKEIEFQSTPEAAIEALISINNQLGQPDAAEGILLYAKQLDAEVALQSSWYAKLGRWDDALSAYEAQLLEEPDSLELLRGHMDCLANLGKWEELAARCDALWERNSDDDKIRVHIAPMAARAALSLSRWDEIGRFVEFMDDRSADTIFHQAVMAIHNGHTAEALSLITRSRELLDTELTALVGESYDRAYRVVIRVQALAELEEVIKYKTADPTRRATIQAVWTKRLLGAQANVDVWQRLLPVHSLVLPPHEDMESWIEFASMCRRCDSIGLAEKTLGDLLGCQPAPGDPIPTEHPFVALAWMKLLWTKGEQEAALSSLRSFIGDGKGSPEFKSECHLKYSEWVLAATPHLTDDIIADVLGSCEVATTLQPDWYKAWHTWAKMSFEVVSHYEKIGQREELSEYASTAISGFFKAIELASGNTLQDALRLLTLWFKYGNMPATEAILKEGFSVVSVDTWLEVIPQIIARIHTPNMTVRRLIHDLLTLIGRRHPQALVYPLTVASKSQSVTRKTAAIEITEKLRQHSPTLVAEAQLVSEELIRVAILWHEQWHEGLEEASRVYFGDHDVDAMFRCLMPLHRILEKGPETQTEVAFSQAYRADLTQAERWCYRYIASGRLNSLNSAWDLYYHVFRQINKQLPLMKKLELPYVSPKLVAARDLALAVPGTYAAGKPVITIASFAPSLTVIPSKQRPRKTAIFGSNGREYCFALKGHEDLRQDERVMQLFNLINTLLSTDSVTSRKHLAIKRYEVIPLAPNSGLLSWVPNCDTLHGLIKEYREDRKILINIEHRLIVQMAPQGPTGYDNLTAMQKIEVFENALNNTTGQDLYKVLWLKSPNSEAWLERRTNFTRSLAAMSMAGYILGLGDRHPSNIMLDRYTGKMMHIDFGDCFEVAINRDKYPERVPFRLTRMLINAMEVSGIEGNYRFTCEAVMRVLREHKDALKAVLEAFVYDPLINWRILAADKDDDGPPKGVDDDMTGRPHGLMDGDDDGDGDGGDGDDDDDLDDDDVDLRSTGGESSDGGEDVPAETMRTTRFVTNEADLVTAEAEAAIGDNNEVMMPALNARAVEIVDRIDQKLTGRDFGNEVPLDVKDQVDKLIREASSHANLSQSYLGWCPFW